MRHEVRCHLRDVMPKFAKRRWSLVDWRAGRVRWSRSCELRRASAGLSHCSESLLCVLPAEASARGSLR